MRHTTLQLQQRIQENLCLLDLASELMSRLTWIYFRCFVTFISSEDLKSRNNYLTGSKFHQEKMCSNSFANECTIVALQKRQTHFGTRFSRFTDRRHLAERPESTGLSGVHYDHRSEAARRAQYGSDSVRAGRRSAQIHQRQGIHQLSILQ